MGFPSTSGSVAAAGSGVGRRRSRGFRESSGCQKSKDVHGSSRRPPGSLYQLPASRSQQPLGRAPQQARSRSPALGCAQPPPPLDALPARVARCAAGLRARYPMRHAAALLQAAVAARPAPVRRSSRCPLRPRRWMHRRSPRPALCTASSPVRQSRATAPYRKREIFPPSCVQGMIFSCAQRYIWVR
ncbi:hypothetical protein PVAP13_9KG137385 [Panicum virgatum]|uniref:Uncharacterized protein n=1 Tax=Panicum virgatum TaxID=38727 RepID=A0A8T0NFE0_PANVG|nr:hypothetical protein PVAP13_9KG137385 [Panicum virgatum]